MTLQASPQGMQWFQDSRFGMFIHWGLYALYGRKEWVMHIDNIPVPEYEKNVTKFNPTRFNADEWVSIAADAGQKYMVLTSRHHDGFSMYDTALSDYKVTRTPFGRDPAAELANAVAKRGDIKLGFYSSLLDWHHPAYRFRDESSLVWADYIAFLHGQVRELCTNYGELACLWFDGDWPRRNYTDQDRYFLAGGSFEYDTLYNMIHTLQPHAVIQNNRHVEPLPGEDIQGFEQDLPGDNTAGFNTTHVTGLPPEVCMTINDNWGYHATDHNHKTTRRLIDRLVRSASVGANFLLNVGPTPEGEIMPTQAERLRKVGEWVNRHSEALYGTRAGVIPPTDVTVSTLKGDTHYVYILNDISDAITLSGLPNTVQHAALVHSGQPVTLEAYAGGHRVVIPETLRDPLVTVVRLSP